MLYGYDTGIISGALLQITKDFGIAEGWKQVIAASILFNAGGLQLMGWLTGSETIRWRCDPQAPPCSRRPCGAPTCSSP
jgi:hypothetical protein